MDVFGSATLRVRPIRLAFLVEPNNAAQVREAIQICSTIWGGMFCPIVPLHKRMPKSWQDGPVRAPHARNVVTGYINAFDPDILVQMSGEVPAYIKDLKLEVITPTSIWDGLEDGRALAPKYAIGIFEILEEVFEQNFKFKTKYPLKLVFPRLPADYQLFWASVLGELPAPIVRLLKEHYYEPLEVLETDFKPEDLASVTDERVLFPRRLTAHGLRAFGRTWPRDAFAFFLDATNTEDIIDFWNLRALGRSVLPIPKQLQGSESLKSLTEEYFREHRIPWRNNKAVCSCASLVRSRHSTMQELESYVRTLKFERSPDDSSNSAFLSLQDWYPRIWDEWASNKDGAVPDDIYRDEESIELRETQHAKFLLRPKLPSFASKSANRAEWRCANDISFNMYGSDEPLAEAFPRSRGKKLLAAVAGRFRVHDGWRIGRNGVVRLVKDDLPEAWEVPHAEEILFAWLDDYGWTAELSAPGRLAKQMHKQLEGYPFVLKNEHLLRLLEYMNGGDRQDADEDRVNQQRELSVGEIHTRLRKAGSPNNVVDYLIGKGVFRVGLTLQCPHCTRRSWYSSRTLGDVFNCPRCLNEFSAIGHVEMAKWAYKTAGPFSVPRYADGAFATLLAVAFFSERNLSSLQVTPAFSFIARDSGKTTLEADFALFWRESVHGEPFSGVAFGECKTYGQFGKKDFERMRHLAKTFPGAVIVFATLRKTLTAKEIQAIKRIATTGRTQWKSERPINPVLILTGYELLCLNGPPHCWQESNIGQKFVSVSGLFDICNATQQLHLGLPPWEQVWYERLEKRRRTKGRATF